MARESWLETQYPAIKARAGAERGAIHWGTEGMLPDVGAGGPEITPRGRALGATAADAIPGNLAMMSTVTGKRKLSCLIR